MCECTVLVPQKFPELKGIIIFFPKSVLIADAEEMLEEKKAKFRRDFIIANHQKSLFKIECKID